MKRLILGFVVGIITVLGSGAFLGLLLPLLFSAVFREPEAWIGWFPFAVAIPTLIVGGFTAARISRSHRFAIGSSVGLAATSLALIIDGVVGQFWFLTLLVILGGMFSAIGSKFSGRHHVSP